MNTQITIKSSSILCSMKEDTYYYGFTVHANVGNQRVIITSDEDFDNLPDIIHSLEHMIRALDPQPGKYIYSIIDYFEIREDKNVI